MKKKSGNPCENFTKALHYGLAEYTEADVRERRLVFMSAEAPAGEAQSDAKAEGEKKEADSTEGAGGDTEAKKQTDGINFILDRLEISEPVQRQFATKKLQDMKISVVTRNTDNKTIEKVIASYRNIETEIAKDTTKDDLTKFGELKTALENNGLDSFVFLGGSKVDIAAKTATLKVDSKATFGSSAPDALTVNVDITSNTISSLTIEPNLNNPDFQKILDSMKGKPLAELTKDACDGLMKQYSATTENALTDAISKAAPEKLTGDKIISLKGYKKKFEKVFNAFEKGTTDQSELNKIFLIEDSDKQIATVRFEVIADETRSTLIIKREGVDNVKSEFGITKPKDSKTSEVRLAGRQQIEGVVSINDDGLLVVSRGDEKNGSTNTVDLLNDTMSVSVAIGENHAESEQVKISEFKDSFTAKIGDKEGTVTVNADGSVDFGELVADNSATDGGEGKKKQGAIERFFGPGATEQMGGFMGTLEELIATILELLASLGFDLNSDKNKDGSEKSDEDKAARRLQLFAASNQLGLKNIGALKNASIGDMMGVDGKPGLFVEGDMQATANNLEKDGFDISGIHGEKMYEMLGSVHDNIFLDNEDPEDEGNPKIAERLAAKSKDDFNKFIFETDMIDKNGRWTSKWKKFGGMTEGESTEKLEAEKAQTLLEVKALLMNSKGMTELLEGENSSPRQDLANSLQLVGLVTTEAVTEFKTSGGSEDAMRVLLKTIADKKTYFGNENFDIDKAWNPSIQLISDVLTANGPGFGNATTIADNFVKGVTFDKETVQIDASKKETFASILATPITEIEATAPTPLQKDSEEFKTFAKNIGMSADNLLSLLSYLHSPGDSVFTGDKMSLTSIYSITDTNYTLADLLAAALSSTQTSQPVAVADAGSH